MQRIPITFMTHTCMEKSQGWVIGYIAFFAFPLIRIALSALAYCWLRLAQLICARIIGVSRDPRPRPNSLGDVVLVKNEGDLNQPFVENKGYHLYILSDISRRNFYLPNFQSLVLFYLLLSLNIFYR